jgi:uncharacterized protein
VVTSCGGGLYAHRYRSDTGFDNPSVFCSDLEKIITHVRSGLRPVAGPAAPPRSALALPGDQFDALASGYGDSASMELLVNGQRSRQRALLALLSEQAEADHDGAFNAGWELAAQVGHEHAAALARVLAHPYIRAWSEECLRASTVPERAGNPPAGRAAGLPTAAAYMASIAAAAAIRAGVRAEIEVPVTGGYLHLPTLGRLRVGLEPSANLTVADGGFEVRAPSGKWHVQPAEEGPDADWERVRELRSGQFTVLLEDTDAYRDCHQWPAARRLNEREAAGWQDQFAVAWPLIERSFPGYLPGLTAGLSTLMPLANDVPGREISAAARQAFGSVGAALPADGSDLALLLLHEFQHGKLYAVLDLFDLCDPADSRLFYAPWREDPRPLEALLQGTYAHLAVTDFWRVRRHELSGPDVLTAAERFARWRMLTAEAVETLAGSGALTPAGARFVDGMRATVQPWLDEPVAEAAAAAARRWTAERLAGWRQRREPERR